jgi:hypothetical protein
MTIHAPLRVWPPVVHRCVRLFAFAALSLLSGASCGTEFEGCEATRTCEPAPNAGKGGAGMGSGGGTSGAAGRAGAASGNGGASAGVSGQDSASAGESGRDGGEGGNAGDAGAGGAEPCEGECSGRMPICDLTSDTCVECTSNAHCDDDLPVCDPSSHTCVECTAEDAAVCERAASVCDPDTTACVQCLGNESCTAPDAPLCGERHECAPCASDEDCAHISDLGVCNSGECVECTASDETACGQNSCDPATNRCTKTRRGTLGTCVSCLADSECEGFDQSDPEQRCVPMHFQSAIRAGGVCLRPVTKGCVSPYMVPVTRPSLSGAEREAYCGIDELTTRCEAVLDMIASRPCAGDDTACGCARDWAGNCLEAGSGGVCRQVGAFADRCAYECGGDNQCPLGTSCSGIPRSHCQ